MAAVQLLLLLNLEFGSMEQNQEQQDETVINPEKTKINMNVIKLVVYVAGISTLSFQAGMIYRELKGKVTKWDGYQAQIDSLEQWRREVTAYYYPKDKKTN